MFLVNRIYGTLNIESSGSQSVVLRPAIPVARPHPKTVVLETLG